jgi:hypothetical protein
MHRILCIFLEKLNPLGKKSSYPTDNGSHDYYIIITTILL